MKLLFLGEIGLGQTSRMRMSALKRLGYDAVGVNTFSPWKEVSWLGRQAERRLGRGVTIDRINRSVLEAFEAHRPAIVWAEKQEFLRAETISRLRAGGAVTIHFTPDPYFSLSWKRTSLMDDAIGRFDALVYCKAYERAGYEALRRPLAYMPLGYCDEVHRPLPADATWKSDVGFLGGWEPRRERLLRAVADVVESLKIWGGYWDFLADGRWTLRRQIIMTQLAGADRFSIRKDAKLAAALQGGEVYDADYARALSNARIGLGFLREVCPDQHTTRTFEIPACGSLLLADRTAEHQAFFEEGKEAEFFDSRDELVDKVRYYLGNEPARRAMAAAGRERCMKSGYSYLERLRGTLKALAAETGIGRDRLMAEGSNR